VVCALPLPWLGRLTRAGEHFAENFALNLRKCLAQPASPMPAPHAAPATAAVATMYLVLVLIANASAAAAPTVAGERVAMGLAPMSCVAEHKSNEGTIRSPEVSQ
jgi:hypothetical protein